MNWKIITTKKGRLTYAACNGDTMIREFSDIAWALKYEQTKEFSNTLNDFMAEEKLAFEAEQKDKYFERKIERLDSTSFKALQRKINKIKQNEQLKLKY